MEASKWPVPNKTLSESKSKRKECEEEGKGILQCPADQRRISCAVILM